MLVKQISLFVENKSGRLAEVTRILAENLIDINAISIADTTSFGILRMIVNDPDKAEEKLKDAGFTVGVTNVIAIALKDEPGALAEALGCLEGSAAEIEYMYAFVGKFQNKALVILKVNDEEISTVIDLLLKNGIQVLKAQEVYAI